MHLRSLNLYWNDKYGRPNKKIIFFNMRIDFYNKTILTFLTTCDLEKHCQCPIILNTHTHTHTHTQSFNNHFPGLPGQASTRRINHSGVAVASARPYANHLHFAPDRQPCQHLITQVFTGRMPFLPPNQRRQSTEGNAKALNNNNNSNNISSELPVCASSSSVEVACWPQLTKLLYIERNQYCNGLAPLACISPW